jgi:hypothetical protein
MHLEVLICVFVFTVPWPERQGEHLASHMWGGGWQQAERQGEHPASHMWGRVAAGGVETA